MDECEYYRGRAEAERRLAREAASSKVAAIHSELAMRYNLAAETRRTGPSQEDETAPAE